MHLPLRRPLAWAPALAAAALLVACQAPAPPVDPLDVETPFAFEVANPDELEGPVFGILLQPFEEGGFLRNEVTPPNLDLLLDAFVEADLTTDGEVAGTFVAPRAVPRINESTGVVLGPRARGPVLWWVFFPPAQCPLTATNAVDAALAPLFDLLLWDGDAVDESGYPASGGRFVLGEETYESADGVETWTFEGYLPVVSRAAWSATSDGACSFVNDWDEPVLLDVDLDIEVGWQFLHLRSQQRYDGMAWSYEDEIRSLTLDEIAGMGPIGEVRAGLPVVGGLGVDAGAVLPAAFARWFR